MSGSGLSTSETGELVLGRYRLGDRIATGGMGEVYVAVQQGLGGFAKPLALKLLLPHLARDPSAVELFLHEATLAARMSHPNVVQIFDVGREGDRYYLAMELVRGVSLSHLIKELEARQKLLPPAMLTYVAHALCDGLHHAHELTGPSGERLDLVHRDVTPHNLLLSVDGAVKLADFGIAKVSNSAGYTAPGTVKGKLEYVAPELFEGHPADRRSDVYAAAVTLFQLATLRSPFRRDSDASTMRAIVQDGLPPLRAIRQDLPPEFQRALERATAKVPAERLESALALRQAIPALHDASTAAALGKLVELCCGQAVSKLDAQTAQTRRRTGTASVSEPVGVAPSRRVPGSVLAVGGGLVALGVGLGVALAWPRGAAAVAVQPPAVVEAPSASLDAGSAERPSEPDAGGALAAAPRPAEPVPDERPAPKGATPRRESPRRGVGYLSVDAVPWAQVLIGGSKIGETPIYAYPVKEGEALVVLQNPETGKEVRRKVRVVSGQKSVVKADLR